MSLQKSFLLRGGTDIRSDDRCALFSMMYNLSTEEIKQFLYPTLYKIYPMNEQCGYPIPEEMEYSGLVMGENNISMPDNYPLSNSSLSSENVFIMDDGLTLYMWIGKNVENQWIKDVLDLDSLSNIDCSRIILPELETQINIRINNIINALRENKTYFQKVNITFDDNSNYDKIFRWKLIEDRSNFPGGAFSYDEYMAHMKQTLGIQR